MALGEYLGAGSATTKGLYHLNGNATDSSGNGNNGTATNVTRVDGKIGSGAGSFNGSSSRIDLPTTVIPTGNRDFTIGARVNPSKFLSYTILFLGNTSTSNSCGISIGGIAESYRFYFFVRGQTNILGPQTYIVGKWYNVMATYIASTRTAYLYVDGEQVGSRFYSSLNVSSTGAYIGFYPTNNTNAIIDEVIIEHKTWTAQEVRKYYTYSRGQFGIL